jgi:hypothetical protein
MRAPFKNPFNSFAPFFLVLMAIFVFGFGCNASNTPKPTPDPLAGFHVAALFTPDSNKAITDDYKDYIQTLSPEEKKYLGPSPVSFFEDGTGQHAVEIIIGINGRWWRHVLIYDKDNKRIKTIKYATGYYAS